MDKRDTYNDDFLRSYINPGKIEKAPLEFTSKTMTRIRLEAGSVTRQTVKWIVPVFSALITAALLAAILLLNPSEEAGSLFTRISGLIPDLNLTLPNPDFRFFKNFNLPDWTIYSTVCIFILAFFDRVLWVIFHREE